MKVILIIFLSLPINLLAAGQWNQKSNLPATARHRSSAFTIGDKGYVGMGHYNTGQHVIFKDLWEYDPATDSWTQKADFAGTLRYQCAAFGIGDYGYMGLGRNVDDNYEQDFWKYDPSANLWYPIADFPGVPRRGATAFVINKKGYVGLGQTTAGYATDFYKYKPNSDTWEAVADFIGAPRMNPVSFVNNGKAYVGVGHTWGQALNDFYEFNPTSNYWLQKANVGDSTRQDATGFAVMGNGYIGLGNNVDGSQNYKDFWQYNFYSDSWTRINDFPGSARRYAVSFVIGNTAYCQGGTNGTNLNDFWSFNALLSVDENSENNLVKPYPNPASNAINFNLKSLNNVTIEIFNSVGQQILILNNVNSILQVKRNQLPAGFYFFTITSNQKVIQTGKFIFNND